MGAVLKGTALRTTLREQRIRNLVLPNGIIIRDQWRIPPRALTRALPPDITPSDWYRFLNGFVFLWPTRERVDRHLPAFEVRPQKLLVIDAMRLLKEKSEELFLSPINSGNAMRHAAPRSYQLFVPYNEWLDKGWPTIQEHARPRSTAPAEIAIKGHLPLERFLVEVRDA